MQKRHDIHIMDGQEVIVLNMSIIDGGKTCENNLFGDEMQTVGMQMQQQHEQKWEKHHNMALLQYFLQELILTEDMVTLL